MIAPERGWVHFQVLLRASSEVKASLVLLVSARHSRRFCSVCVWVWRGLRGKKKNVFRKHFYRITIFLFMFHVNAKFDIFPSVSLVLSWLSVQRLSHHSLAYHRCSLSFFSFRSTHQRNHPGTSNPIRRI